MLFPYRRRLVLDMDALLISDLHLDMNKPQLTAILLRCLEGPGRLAKSVFLLGDIFETWVGDDDRSALAIEVGQALKRLSASGVRVCLMHGNRDFLIGTRYASEWGLELLHDPTILELGGVTTLLSHGDRYCTDDEAYQAFRAKSRTPAWQAKVLGMPLFIRRGIALYGRWKSKRHYRSKQAAGMISDVNDGAMVSELSAHPEVRRLIHGHTHRPDVHWLTTPDGRVVERVVLADWREHGEAVAIEGSGRWTRLPLA